MNINRLELPVSRLARGTRLGLRQAQRGVTLFEVLIVVAILAMVAGGVAVFALPRFREAQVDTAVTGARAGGASATRSSRT